MEWLAEYRPELVSRYEELYGRGAYMAPDERRRLSQLLQGPSQAPRQRSGRMLRSDQAQAGPVRGRPARQTPSRTSPAQPRIGQAAQESLF